MSEIKERGILFNTEMVNAVLAGRKTQTRRLVKGKPTSLFGIVNLDPLTFLFSSKGGNFKLKSPYGKIGDHIYVRERVDFFHIDQDISNNEIAVSYSADKEMYAFEFEDEELGEMKRLDERLRKTPSIHMPRWASRILLEITGVRVERLKDISEEDAKAEGCQDDMEKFGIPKSGSITWYAKNSFVHLWQSINGEDSWKENPFVWVYEFKVIEK